MPNQNLSSAVGPRERNTVEDVARTQAMLKLTTKPGTGRPYYEGRIDGLCGPKTEAAIAAFLGDQSPKQAPTSNNTNKSLTANKPSSIKPNDESARALQNACALAIGQQDASNLRVQAALVNFKYVGNQGLVKSHGVKPIQIISVNRQEGTLLEDSAYIAGMFADEYVGDTISNAGTRIGNLITGGDTEKELLAKAELNVHARIKEWKNRNWTEAAKALEHFAKGSGTPLQFNSEDLLKNKRFKQAVDTLKAQWANEIQGLKSNNDSKLSTYEGLFNAALLRQSGQRTNNEDHFVNRLRQDETLQMGSSLGLTFGGTSIYAAPYQGLEITAVTSTQEGIVVQFVGDITFSLLDPYDFKGALPGARDANKLVTAGKAKPFDMQVKWVERLEGSITFAHGLKGLKKFDADNPTATLAEPKLQWTLVAHNVPITKDDADVRKEGITQQSQGTGTP